MSRVLVLASRSPRRRDLLAEAGIASIGEPADVEELIEFDGPPAGLALANAEMKATIVALRRPDDVVLGADTIVTLDGEIFGKPRDRAHAEEMLARLSGRIHEVITGVCVMAWNRHGEVKFTESTRVKFKELSAEQIREYLGSIDPFDKAGAYAAQEDNGRIIECVEGSFTNVIGLPMERTLAALRERFNF